MNKNKFMVKYGTLIGVAFIVNMTYSVFNDLSAYSLDSAIRTLLFSIVLLLGSVWGKMDFDNLDKN